MKLEHVALQVADPVGLSRWYVEQLGLTVKRAQAASPFGHFLADDGDAVMLEFYGNPRIPVPDYARMEPLALHLAFHVEDHHAVEALAAEAPRHGWTLMFPDRHPHAGGERTYAAYLENTDGFEVELVADAPTGAP